MTEDILYSYRNIWGVWRVYFNSMDEKSKGQLRAEKRYCIEHWAGRGARLASWRKMTQL
jgi:hypothetical protein